MSESALVVVARRKDRLDGSCLTMHSSAPGKGGPAPDEKYVVRRRRSPQSQRTVTRRPEIEPAWQPVLGRE